MPSLKPCQSARCIRARRMALHCVYRDDSRPGTPYEEPVEGVSKTGTATWTWKDDVIAARQHLTQLGYVEGSGDRRPDSTGTLQPVWRISALGHVADHYRHQGFSLEAAMALARMECGSHKFYSGVGRGDGADEEGPNKA